MEADSSQVHLEEAASMPIFVTTKIKLYHKIKNKMGTKVIVKFRIRPRRVKAPATGKDDPSVKTSQTTRSTTDSCR